MTIKKFITFSIILFCRESYIYSQTEVTDFEKIMRVNKICKRIKLSSWKSTYNKSIIYKWISDSVSRDGIKFCKIKFDYKSNKDNFSAYLKIVNDTIFWLDQNANNANALPQMRKEQKFLILTSTDTSRLSLFTSTTLFTFCDILLMRTVVTSEDTTYYYNIFSNTKGISDYIIPVQLVVSKKKWIESITVESSLGDKKNCKFYFRR